MVISRDSIEHQGRWVDSESLHINTKFSCYAIVPTIHSNDAALQLLTGRRTATVARIGQVRASRYRNIHQVILGVNRNPGVCRPRESDAVQNGPRRGVEDR